MSRFQAQLNAVLGEELEDLRNRLGLRRNQKTELLREIALLASWVVRQAEAGCSIEARRGRDADALASPLLDRLRERRKGVVGRIELKDSEEERLAELLSRGFSPTPALLQGAVAACQSEAQTPEASMEGWRCIAVHIRIEVHDRRYRSLLRVLQGSSRGNAVCRSCRDPDPPSMHLK